MKGPDTAMFDRAAPPMADPAPFLKWAGGKTQLIPVIDDLLPPELKAGKIRHYFEPFIGGGALFFHVSRAYPSIERFFLYDRNADLCLAYQVVKSHVDGLIGELGRLKEGYLRLTPAKRERFYAKVREDFNGSRNGFAYGKHSAAWIERAAQLLFLNKTCFNGLYRVNRDGDFNVPIGRYKRPSIFDPGNLRAASWALSRAEILHADYAEIEAGMPPKSFVYFDPPYRPISPTSSFKAYAKDGFGDREQAGLAALFERLSKRKQVYLMLSNSDPKNVDPRDEFFDELYGRFRIRRVSARRMINSVAARRGGVNEIIVTNY